METLRRRADVNVVVSGYLRDFAFAQPARQDVDYTLARKALAAGCLFALDSDAHTTEQLAYAETALAHARLAAIPSDRIVNCWPLDRLLAWVSKSGSAAAVLLDPLGGRGSAVARHERLRNDMKITPTERDEMDDRLSGDAAIAKARQLLPSFPTTMFVTKTEDGHELHMRPVAMQGDPSVFGGTLWFFADDRSRKVREIEAHPQVSLMFQNDQKSCYLQLTGTASAVRDRPKMRELYTAMLKTWFPDGLDDSHLTLIRFDASGGAFWENPGGTLQVLAAFTKSVLTGRPGKGGNAGTIEL